MKKNIVYILFLIVIFTSVCVLAKKVTLTKKIGNFNSLYFKTDGNLYIKKGDKNYIVVKGEQKAVSHLKTYISKDRLYIEGGNASGKKIYLIAKNIESLRNESTGNVYFYGFKGKSYTLANIGSGRINASRINAHNLKIVANGIGTVNLYKDIKTDNIEIRINKSGQVILSALYGKNMTVVNNGRKDLKANKVVLSDTLKVELNRIGSVKIAALKVKNLYLKSTFGGDLSANFSGTSSDIIKLDLISCGNVFLKGINADKVDVEIKSSGDIIAEGKAQDQKVIIRGAGSYYASKLKTKNATVNNYGGGDAAVSVSDNLNLTIMGAGDVDLYGNPVKRKRIRGMGQLKIHS